MIPFIPFIIISTGGYLLGNSIGKPKFYRGGVTPGGVDYTIDFHNNGYKYQVSSDGFTFFFVENKLLSNQQIEEKFDEIFSNFAEQQDIAKQYDYLYKKGGKVYEYSIEKGNNLMLQSKVKEVKHHADELNKIVNDKTKVDGWVVAKAERSASDLSDITHYLDGRKYASGGKISVGDKIEWGNETAYVEKVDGDNISLFLNYPESNVKGKIYSRDKHFVVNKNELVGKKIRHKVSKAFNYEEFMKDYKND